MASFTLAANNGGHEGLRMEQIESGGVSGGRTWTAGTSTDTFIDSIDSTWTDFVLFCAKHEVELVVLLLILLELSCKLGPEVIFSPFLASFLLILVSTSG